MLCQFGPCCYSLDEEIWHVKRKNKKINLLVVSIANCAALSYFFFKKKKKVLMWV